MKKLIALIGLVLVACNVPSMLVDLGPRYGGADGFPENGTGIISFKLESNGAPVQSWWVRIENGQMTSERYLFTRSGTEVTNVNPLLKPEEMTLMLKPGIYYLNGFEIWVEGKEPQKYNTTMDYQTERGWLPAINKPQLLAVEVKAGEQVRLPDLNLTYRTSDVGDTYYYLKESPKYAEGKAQGEWIWGAKMNKAK